MQFLTDTRKEWTSHHDTILYSKSIFSTAHLSVLVPTDFTRFNDYINTEKKDKSFQNYKVECLLLYETDFPQK